MLTALNVRFKKWMMNINYNKSLVMHIRPRAVQRSMVDFLCGDNKLDYIDKCRYLGLYFSEYLDMTETVRHVSQSAHRALGMLIAIRSNGMVASRSMCTQNSV